jgi:hypothetical protein
MTVVSLLGIAPGTARSAPLAAGDQLWIARYAGPDHFYDAFADVAISPEGSTVYATGSSANFSFGDDWITGAFDAASGETRWSRREQPADSELSQGTRLAPSPDGSRVFVIGKTEQGAKADYTTLALDAATGQRLWGRRYNGPGASYDFPLGVAVSPDGSRVFVTGWSEGIGTGYWDWATVAYDAATGHRVWAQRLNGPGNGSDTTSSIAVSPDGSRLYITGSIEISTSDTDYLTIACDADTGARLWARRYDGSANSFDFATAMTLSSDGSRIVVTGYSRGIGTSDDYATIAYDARDGASLWDVRYDGPGHDSDEAESIAINPDGGSVVVTGRSAGAQTGADFGTAVYDMATGTLVWARRYKTIGVNDDIARSVVTSPDGATVYVTGSTGSDHPDLTTLAYAGSTGILNGRLCMTVRVTGPTFPNRWW